MTLNIYAMKDELTGFKNLILMHNDAEAMRQARWFAKNQENQVEDMSLVYLGRFNQDTGNLTPDKPHEVANLQTLREAENG